MEKKAKIIATLGPAIYSENKLKKLVDLGVDAFRINFSHNTNCLLYTSPSPRDLSTSRMPSSA